MKLMLTGLFGLVLAASAGAQVYKRVDENGNVTYSDEPAPGAEPITLPEIQTYTPPKRKAAPATPKDDAGGAAEKPMPAYKVTMVSPGNEATVIQNEGTVQFSASIVPPLRETERVVFYLDGQRVGKPSASPAATATFVDRGAHTARAEVLDKNGAAVASSPSVTFYLRRFFRKPQQ